MQRHKQGPSTMDQVKQMSQETPAIGCVILSVRLTDAEETNFFDRLTQAWSTWFSSEHQRLWERAEHFFQREMGLRGHLLKVHGDLTPAAADYLILALCVQLQPALFLKAKEFMKECASCTTLKLQLQIGGYFVVDHSGISSVARTPFFSNGDNTAMAQNVFSYFLDLHLNM